MPRIRTLKPEILEDEKTAHLSDAGYRLFTSLICLADDYGNMRGDPSWLRGQIWWAHNKKPAEVTSHLDELASAGLVFEYEVSEQRYISIINWDKHQRVDRPGKPRVPRPPENFPGNFPGTTRNPRKKSWTLATDPDLRPPTRDPDPEREKEKPFAQSDKKTITHAPAVTASPPVASLQTNTGDEVSITQADLETWGEAFPAVSVLDEIKRAKAWLDANPTRRKTKAGMRRFLVSWLGRVQDRGGNGARASPPPAKPPPYHRAFTPEELGHEPKGD